MCDEKRNNVEETDHWLEYEILAGSWRRRFKGGGGEATEATSEKISDFEEQVEPVDFPSSKV